VRTPLLWPRGLDLTHMCRVAARRAADVAEEAVETPAGVVAATVALAASLPAAERRQPSDRANTKGSPVDGLCRHAPSPCTCNVDSVCIV
jgi:hypothetical protein